jgi:hypothetical protein
MFCAWPGKDQDHLRLQRAHILTIALTGMTSLPIPSAGIKPILSVFLTAVVSGRKAMLVYVNEARDTPIEAIISDNVTNSFSTEARRVVAFGASSSPLIRRCPPLRSHTMMHSPISSTQREALVNCTNVTAELIHNNPKPPTPSVVHALFKRSRPTDDGSARLKRLKFSIGESRTGEDERVDSVDESEEDSDGSSIAYCTARRKRTIFRAKNALAMSRPGVTCRPLPCEPSSLVASSSCR